MYNTDMNKGLDSEIHPSDGLFPIRHVCAETGINPVTLRAWERRYGLIRPVRTPKGHRLYSAEDIERIRRILTLLDDGIAVSQVGRVLNHQGTGSPAANESPPSAPVSETRTGREGAGLAAHTLDPLSEAMLQATREFSSLRLERVYARLVMHHGWEGVHDRAFLETYEILREEARHEPVAEARLALFASWALVSLNEQLHSALPLCEGPPYPCIVVGAGHRRIEGLLFLLACARHGLRVLPLTDILSAPALRALGDDLGAPAIVIHSSTQSLHGSDADRLQRILVEDGVPAYLAGSGAETLARLDTPRQMTSLPAGILAAAQTLSRNTP